MGVGPHSSQLRAESVCYDSASRRIEIRFVGGAVFSFPIQLVSPLAGASERELAEVRLSPAHLGLYWETLDVDLEIEGLLIGRFGR